MAGILVGLVNSCEPVPNKDKLKELKYSLANGVDVGQSEDLTIVTNAPNVTSGIRVVVATIGSKVTVDGSEIEVNEANVGGVKSFGMLCDSGMLGWSGGGAGNAALVPDTFAPGDSPPASRPRMDGKVSEKKGIFLLESKEEAPALSAKEKRKMEREAKKAAKAAAKGEGAAAEGAPKDGDEDES